MVHREVADQPRVGIILVCCQDLPDGRQIENVSLRGRPHSLKHNQRHSNKLHMITDQMCNVLQKWLKSIYLVRLVNNDGVIRERFHNVEIFNGS